MSTAVMSDEAFRQLKNEVLAEHEAKIWMVAIWNVQDSNPPKCNYVFFDVPLPIDPKEIYNALIKQGLSEENIKWCNIYTANYWGSGQLLLSLFSVKYSYPQGCMKCHIQQKYR